MNEYPTYVDVKHSDLPELKDAKAGDKVEFHIKGHVHSTTDGDDMFSKSGPKSTIKVDKVQPVAAKPKVSPKEAQNMADMPLSQLKNQVKTQAKAKAPAVKPVALPPEDAEGSDEEGGY